MELEFTKLSGAGNDFIAINNMDGKLPQEGREALFRDWCRRGLSVGADGVLIIEPAAPESKASFRMRYHNANGGEAETCGNGSRCIARFAYTLGVAPQQMTFQTLAGDYTAEVLDNGHVRLGMSDAFDLHQAVAVNPHDLGSMSGHEVHFINTGVPHAVILLETSDLDNVPVVQVGRALRHSATFAPNGTNVNFVRVAGTNKLQVRTYERGVEDETLACGTGCIASAILAARLHAISTPVEVTTASGELLHINFTPAPGGASDVSLEGSANIIYRGTLDLKSL